jgi:hypothetical protein
LASIRSRLESMEQASPNGGNSWLTVVPARRESLDRAEPSVNSETTTLGARVLELSCELAIRGE